MLVIVYDSIPVGDEGSERGQAGVLGFALLIGIVAVGVTTVLLVGGAGLADTQERVEVKQATQTMTLIDSQASTVALGENPVQSVSVDGLKRSGTL
jgi:Tfp pilus assembly protein PilX